ncbi:MAG: hypothetical protein JWO07_394 [Candidatus Saccharibacteria bacterium]|nr:hypothetical protein [Candidatus Saccharibacteria bacterium]
MRQRKELEVDESNMLFSKRIVGIIAIVAVVILAIAMRLSVFSTETDDMHYFLIPWYQHFATYGLHGIANIDSNYNVPYLYLLWLSTHLHLSAIVAIKLITLLFEACFAALVYLIGKDYYPAKKHIPIIMAIASLFIPTLFLQGGLWGQCDIIYTFWLVACWWMMSKGKQQSGWILFGVAIAFKLQAIFFLPYMLYKWFVNSRIKKPVLSAVNVHLFYPLLAVLTIVVLALPAVAFGRPVSMIFGVYAGQVSDPGTSTSLGSAATVFQLFVNMNDKAVLYLAKPAIFFACALVVAIFGMYLTYVKRTTFKDTFTLPLLFLLILPYFLPFMHDRYFFAGEIFALLFAALTRRWFFIVAATLLQATALPLYASYLWHSNVWPAPVLALIQLGVIGLIAWYLYQNSETKSITNLWGLRRSGE